MRFLDRVLYADDKYRVSDTIFAGRPARVLFDKDGFAAQSGIALDDKSELLFDYNQRFMELALAEKPARLLLIGGGAYTLPTALLHALPQTQIDVVEPEAALETIASRFFGLRTDARLRLINGEGRPFLEENSRPYDAVMVDAFIGLEVPESLTSMQAANLIRRNLRANGVFAMNVISAYTGRGAEAIHRYYENYNSSFRNIAVYPADTKFSSWQSQNFLLIARRGKAPLPQLRFAQLHPPED